MNLEELSEFLGKTELDNISVFGKPPERTAGCATEPKLFSINGRIFNIEASEGEKDNVHNICERAGLFRQQMEYFPSSHNRPQVMAGEIDVKYDNIRSPGWLDWFNGLVRDKLIVPDTNILLNHTLSSHMPKVATITGLSRISILELEALAHRDDKGNYTNKPSVKKEIRSGLL